MQVLSNDSLHCAQFCGILYVTKLYEWCVLYLDYNYLSEEQRMFVDLALAGNNVLVDACIGSGKTTAIQVMCNMMPTSKRILYLTYNRLLKFDAKGKIQQSNVRVQNYHGFAYGELMRNGVSPGQGDILQTYNRVRPQPPAFDLLVLDEYQDIEQEIADMLEIVKSANPSMQIIAVGDMAQKIYDKTTLDSASFVAGFLGRHYTLEFTQCFRLSKDLASWLGGIWGKEIVGVNPDCKVETMRFQEIVRYLSKCDPADVLCLGATTGPRSYLLNELEERYPDKFNKNTIWAKISDSEGYGTCPRFGVGIFTTFDGCKGMERDICVVMDWTVDFWNLRLGKPLTKYETLRNVFCVAASRGKRHIIFCRSETGTMLGADTLGRDPGDNLNLGDVAMSTMFDFKLVEQVEAAYDTLEVSTVNAPGREIAVPSSDGLIDLSPCIGVYQEASYFSNSDIDRYIRLWMKAHPDDSSKVLHGWEDMPLESKVLYYTALETNQMRYLYQVRIPFVPSDAKQAIYERLLSRFNRSAAAQIEASIDFYDNGRLAFSAAGFADVVEGGVVYELKFVGALTHVHALQLAMYMVSLGIERGVLWNVRTDEALEVRVPDRQAFLDRVAVAATKGLLKKYEGSPVTDVAASSSPVGVRTEHVDPQSVNANKKSKAFDYKKKSKDFVCDHADACVRLIRWFVEHDFEYPFTVGRLEVYFRKMHIGLPMSGKTLIKYFGYAVCENFDLLRVHGFGGSIGPFMSRVYPKTWKAFQESRNNVA